jgi:hypothetical protein
MDINEVYSMCHPSCIWPNKKKCVLCVKYYGVSAESQNYEATRDNRR